MTGIALQLAFGLALGSVERKPLGSRDRHRLNEHVGRQRQQARTGMRFLESEDPAPGPFREHRNRDATIERSERPLDRPAVALAAIDRKGADPAQRKRDDRYFEYFLLGHEVNRPRVGGTEQDWIGVVDVIRNDQHSALLRHTFDVLEPHPEQQEEEPEERLAQDSTWSAPDRAVLDGLFAERVNRRHAASQACSTIAATSSTTCSIDLKSVSTTTASAATWSGAVSRVLSIPSRRRKSASTSAWVTIGSRSTSSSQRRRARSSTLASR